MIELQNVTKRYPGNREALSQLDLVLERGEMAFLTGPSGAGKSTLLKLIAAIERPTRGHILINQKNITHIPKRSIPNLRRFMGIVFQNHHLLYDRSVFDNVSLPLQIAGYSRAEISRRVRAALDKVALLHRDKAMPITLSGGEQQRVGIARAVVHKPAILLADEPTGNLDPELSAEIMQLFSEFNQVGVTVLIASHDLDLISRMGKRIVRLEDGRCVNGQARAA
ncbi:MAG: cell division ATP-binding protein FtsE [Gammaproteobacteria bacterium]|nr:cell division ATP-binding protein FtsE [Gammaproteobacteria bacterium]